MTQVFKHFAGCAVACTIVAANAQTFSLDQHSLIQSTYLLDIRQDTTLTRRARALREGGYETAAGEAVSFRRWYSTDRQEIQVTFLTQVSKQFGVVWGFGTGENAEKYRIAPSVQLGAIYRTNLSNSSSLLLGISATLGGELRESACTADYGDIAGIRTVNCRLAAGTMQPEETLMHLEYAKPDNHLRVSYTKHFN